MKFIVDSRIMAPLICAEAKCFCFLLSWWLWKFLRLCCIDFPDFENTAVSASFNCTFNSAVYDSAKINIVICGVAMLILFAYCKCISRPVTSLGHQWERKVFCEGPKFFNRCPTHFSKGCEKFWSIVTGLCISVEHVRIDAKQHCQAEVVRLTSVLWVKAPQSWGFPQQKNCHKTAWFLIETSIYADRTILSPRLYSEFFPLSLVQTLQPVTHSLFFVRRLCIARIRIRLLQDSLLHRC